MFRIPLFTSKAKFGKIIDKSIGNINKVVTIKGPASCRYL